MHQKGNIMLPFRPHWCLHTHNTTSTKSELKLLPRGSEQQQICILCKIKSVFNEQLLKDATCSCHFSAPLDRRVGPNTLAVVAQHHYRCRQLQPHWQRLAGDKWTFWDSSGPEATFSADKCADKSADKCVGHQKFAHLLSKHTCTFYNVFAQRRS